MNQKQSLKLINDFAKYARRHVRSGGKLECYFESKTLDDDLNEVRFKAGLPMAKQVSFILTIRPSQVKP